MAKNKTFLNITNKDIYCKLNDIENTINEIKLHAVETNGKVKFNSLLTRLCLVLVFGVIATITGFKLGGIF